MILLQYFIGQFLNRYVVKIAYRSQIKGSNKFSHDVNNA